jgi:glycosyltransferase involved in cell wall biosynthesis
MRVLLAVVHHSVFGGPHNQLLRLAAPLATRGWETVAVLPEGTGNAAGRLREAGIRVLQAPLHRPRKTLHPKPHVNWILGFLPEISLLRRIIREERAEVVQVAGPLYPQGAIAAHLENVPVVWQLLGLFTPFPIRCITMPLVLSLSDVVMTTGITIARAHPGALRLHNRLVPFYPPVDTDQFRPDAARRRAAREELGVPADRVLIGTVGNFTSHKGHDLLVRAAATVQKRFPRAAFRILGTRTPSHAAYYDKHVRNLTAELGLQNDVKFVEPGDRVAELLPAFDMFIMPSRVEGIPTSVLEAMASGLPVIATDVGGVREVVENGVTGRVVKAGRSAPIADAICDLLEAPSLLAQMGALARRRAVEQYDLKICAGTHQAAYELAQITHSGKRRAGKPAEQRISETSH